VAEGSENLVGLAIGSFGGAKYGAIAPLNLQQQQQQQQRKEKLWLAGRLTPTC